VCAAGTRRETPIGEHCGFCEEPIEAGDRGLFVYTTQREVPAHRECSFRQVVGGIGHHEDHDFWCSSMRDPDAGLSYRQSALRVWALHEERAR
jgi:hypothetical protein